MKICFLTVVAVSGRGERYDSEIQLFRYDLQPHGHRILWGSPEDAVRSVSIKTIIPDDDPLSRAWRGIVSNKNEGSDPQALP